MSVMEEVDELELLVERVDEEILVVPVSVTLDAPADPASSPRMV